MKKYFALFLVFSCLLVCCQKKGSNYSTVEPSTFATEVAKTPNAQLIDVRTPEEFAEEHIKNAQNINWNDSQFAAQIEKLDKSKPVFVYCKMGGRSQKAATKLQEMGFITIYELNGGFMKWSMDGFQK